MPGMATPFSLRLRLHYKAAHAGGVTRHETYIAASDTLSGLA